MGRFRFAEGAPPARTSEFVVNLVSMELAQKMNSPATSLPDGESEFERFGIPSAPSATVKPPRVAEAPVAFECMHFTIVPMGEGPLAAQVIFRRIRFAQLPDDVVGVQGGADSLGWI